MRFCWSSHLPSCWYIFLMFFIHLCSKEDLANDDWSIPIVFIWSSRRDDCNMHFITTHCCSNVLIDRMESMNLFNTLDLTHCAAWGDLFSTWKHKYSLPSGGKCVVFGNSTGKRGKLVINGVKRGGCRCGLNTDIMFAGCYTGVDIICIWDGYLVFNKSTVFILKLMRHSSWVKVVVYDVLFAEDYNKRFLIVGLDIFDWLYL